jgi:hypothetical protein
MPTIGEMYPGRFLKALDDVPPPPEGIDDLTIANLDEVEMETRKGVKEKKWVLFFSTLEKGLVLNKTNATTLARAFGSNSDDWIGHRVGLRVQDVQFGSDLVPAIRIVIPKAVPAPITKPKGKSHAAQ